MPLWLEKIFNSRAILKYAAKKAGSTRTDGLEEMTISMLNGMQGRQNVELQELIDFLKTHEKPDVVHLSNALLLGLAKEIRKQLNIPVVCSLQDEDVWVDAMKPEYCEKVWNLMSQKADDIDAFISVSNFYAEKMKSKMKIPENKLFIVPIGIEPNLYQYTEPVMEPPVVSYLSRLNVENGFEIFIDAFIKLKQHKDFKNIRAKVSGGYTSDDKLFIHKQLAKLKKAGFINDFEIVGKFDKENRSEFFNNTTLLSVPVLKGEAFGTYQLESLACGTPLVQPDLGAFNEIAIQTGGGVVYSPNTANALAEKWMDLLSNPSTIFEMAKNGLKSATQDYSNAVVTHRIFEVYQKVTGLKN